MKAFLITAVVCFSAITFFAASRLTPINTGQSPDQGIADALGAQLSEIQTSTASEIAELKEVILAHQAEVNALAQPSEDLALERDNLAEALAQTQAELAAATEAATLQTTDLDQTTAQLTELEAQRAELDARLAEADATIQTLNETIATNRTNSEALVSQINTLRQEAESATARVAELESQTPDATTNTTAPDAEVALLQTQIAERDASLETLRDEIAELTASLTTATQTATELESQSTDVTSRVDALTADVAQRDTQIAALETQLAEVETSGEDSSAEIAALMATVQERDATIAELTANQAESAASVDTEALDTQIANLTETLAERDASIAALETSLEQATEAAGAAEPSTTTSESDAQVADLEAQVAQLNEALAAQTQTIETLRLGLGDTPLSAVELAEICVARANAILEVSQITFGTGTTTLNASSVEALERLRDLAIGCQNDDLILEIGGHTDSQGEEQSNQIISEQRAQAVLEFMIGNGVSPEDMRAVGFGETQPIAENTTAAGRAANRRIAFAWQPREVAPEPTEEIETADDSAPDDVASDPAEE